MRQPKNSKRLYVTVMNPQDGPAGCGKRVSLQHARRWVRNTIAAWAGAADGAIRCIPRAPALAVDVTEQSYAICDSGFGLLRYPMASQSTGVQYPTLARQGAGL